MRRFFIRLPGRAALVGGVRAHQLAHLRAAGTLEDGPLQALGQLGFGALVPRLHLLPLKHTDRAVAAGTVLKIGIRVKRITEAFV